MIIFLFFLFHFHGSDGEISLEFYILQISLTGIWVTRLKNVWGAGISRRSLATIMSVQEIGVYSASTIRNVDIPWLSTKQLVECARYFTSTVRNNRLRKECSSILTQRASGWIWRSSPILLRVVLALILLVRTHSVSTVEQKLMILGRYWRCRYYGRAIW